MSNPTETLPDTSIAAVSWTHGDKTNVRVYTQDINGGIRESRYDGASWSGGSGQDVIVKAKPNSPIAVFPHPQAGQVHLYYLTTDDVIQEIYQKYDTLEWKDGHLNQAKVKASPASRLAAFGLGDLNCSVFYQQPDGAIGHIHRVSNVWKHVGSFGDKPLIGTGLAALSFHTSEFAGARVYYQKADGTVTDVAFDRHDSYQDSDLKLSDAGTGTNLSALSNTTLGDPRFQLYFLNKSNWISEGGYYNSEWHFENHPAETHASPNSG